MIKRQKTRFLRTLSTSLNVYLGERGFTRSRRWNGPPDTLSIISIPRSGSTFLCDLLGKHPGVYSCFEVFHRKRVFTCDPESLVRLLNSQFGRNFYGHDDPDLIKFTHSACDRVLDALRELSRDRVFSFKIFPGQLSSGQFVRKILNEKRMGKVLFKRDLLAAYISREKAQKVKKWEFSETTGIRVSLDGRKFRDFVNRATAWFDLAERLLVKSGQRYVTIDYDELTAIPDDRARLAYIIDRIRPLGIALDTPDKIGLAEVEVDRKKQDKAESYRNKIENLDVFRTQLKNLGLESYLG